MSFYSGLSGKQKEAVGLLSVGTFLEYFDLMLYVHMAVLLNDLFFPKTDPFTASLLSAFAFCSMYLLRPFGAVLFGYLGDKIGRRVVIILTTFVMACSCTVIAMLPTYEQIGISAAVIITICRMLQGLSSMGEVVSSEIYLTEFIKKPYVYPAVAFLSIACILGGTVALLVSFVAVKSEHLWRGAFFFGALVAIIGFRARLALKETSTFADARKRLKVDKKSHSGIDFMKANYKTLLSFFFMQCTWPTCFYFAFIFCGDLLKNQFHYSAEDVISHNIVVSLIQLFGWSILGLLSFKIHPLHILRFKLYGFAIFVAFCPYLLNTAASPYNIMFIQTTLLILASADIPAAPVIYSHFPILQRFRSTVFIYAISRLIMYTVGSLGLVYLVSLFGNYGILVVMLPLTIGVLLACRHFQKLEGLIPPSPSIQTAGKAHLENLHLQEGVALHK